MIFKVSFETFIDVFNNLSKIICYHMDNRNLFRLKADSMTENESKILENRLGKDIEVTTKYIIPISEINTVINIFLYKSEEKDDISDRIIFDYIPTFFKGDINHYIFAIDESKFSTEEDYFGNIFSYILLCILYILSDKYDRIFIEDSHNIYNNDLAEISYPIFINKELGVAATIVSILSILTLTLSKMMLPNFEIFKCKTYENMQPSIEIMVESLLKYQSTSERTFFKLIPSDEFKQELYSYLNIISFNLERTEED